MNSSLQFAQNEIPKYENLEMMQELAFEQNDLGNEGLVMPESQDHHRYVHHRLAPHLTHIVSRNKKDQIDALINAVLITQCTYH